jgi:lambda family phage portal protein
MGIWPFNRKKKASARGSRGYNGAMYSRLVADWVAATASVDSEIRGALRKLRDRSRDLGRNNDYIKGFYREVQNNVVGRGIPFQAQVKQLRGDKLDQKVNALIEDKWAHWCKKQRCDVAGKLSFRGIQRLAMKAAAEDGEFIVRMIRQSFGGSKVPFALEIIEADLLDENYSGLADNGNEIKMGVEIDKWKRPVAYYFFTKHPYDFQFVHGLDTRERKRVPAPEIIHLFITERAGQTRGVPWIASAIMRLHHMHGFQEAEVIAARASSSLMGFIESDAGELEGDDVQDGQRVTEFEPGVFKQMKPGERVNVPDLKKADGQLEPFIRSMLRGVAAGIGVSYETLSKDYSQSNYSSSRLSLTSDRDNWRVIQDWLIEDLNQIVFEHWLDMAVMAGEINLKGYEIMPERYQSVKWQPRGWGYIDPVKEVTAYKEAVKAGFTTLTEVIGQDGGDFDDVMTQREREVQTAKAKGLIFDTDPLAIEVETVKEQDEDLASSDDTEDT